MGITELIEIKNGHENDLGEKTKCFLNELLRLEEDYEERLKKLL